MASTLRLIKELNQLAADPPHGISAAPISEDNMMMWNATILGPDESPFEGGIYSLSITFSESEYPSKPPKMRFLCEMYHPNIYSNGTICLDVLQDMWSPVQTVGSLLVSVQSLLTARSHVRAQLPPVLIVGTMIIVFSNIKLLLLCCLLCLCTDPNPDSPANPDAAKLFCTNMKEYKKRVRQVAERSLETSF
eukprot:15011-Heterococcus_DN1.PRE.1